MGYPISREKRVSLRIFSRLLQILQIQPWLNDRIDALEELLACCINSGEEKLILDLLKRFKYLTTEAFEIGLKRMANQIINVWEIPKEKAQIVSTTYEGMGTDSGQFVLYPLRTLCCQMGWSKPVVNNICGKALRVGKQRPFIVLVDEFVGTGKTIKSRVKYLSKNLENLGIQNYMIKVCVLASMHEGKCNIEQTGIETFSVYVLKKGITDYYKGWDIITPLFRMTRLESLLKPVIEDNELPSFGYGQAEALYYRNLGGNTPNSVFPIFWWPEYIHSSKRNPILTRVKI